MDASYHFARDVLVSIRPFYEVTGTSIGLPSESDS
jgi:hypothetical protein